MSLYLGENLISGQTTLVGESRNIGQIIPSTIPLTDAGLHLLDGSLIQGGGIYSAFVTYIAGLVSTYPDLFVTEADWQQSISTYGVCGKFVYDSTNNTVRLPKITGIIEGTTDVTALGDLVEAGLPNITGTVDWSNGGQGHTELGTANGAFAKVANTNVTYPSAGSTTSNARGFTIDASRSSSVYGNSTTVQPQTIKAFYYIVVATSTKTDIQVDIDQVATDLNNKMDKSDLQEVQCVVETYQNGSSWYRAYSDGWCEQGGQVTGVAYNSATINVAFLKPFVDTTYCASATRTDGVNYIDGAWINNKTSTGMTIKTGAQTSSASIGPTDWQACGYII